MGRACLATQANIFLRGVSSFSHSREPEASGGDQSFMLGGLLLASCCLRVPWLPCWEGSLLGCPCDGELTPIQAAQPQRLSEAEPQGVSDPLSTPGPAAAPGVKFLLCKAPFGEGSVRGTRDPQL